MAEAVVTGPIREVISERAGKSRLDVALPFHFFVRMRTMNPTFVRSKDLRRTKIAPDGV
jgi:hypothetical protein